MDVKKPEVIVITGPTASGKSKHAMELALKLGGEIISADSMQIYKKLDIGTAKASIEDQELVPHHLIDIVDPWERFTLNNYIIRAKDKIWDIHNRGKVAILCGGTGLYIKTLVEGIDIQDEPEDSQLRLKLEERAKHDGIESLYKEIQNLDPVAAKDIHINNKKRVIRTLEILLTSKTTLAEYHERTRMSDSEFNFHVFMPDFKRDELYQRIEKRVDQMLELGLLDEARYVFELNLPEGSTCLQAIGYKEFFPYFNGEMSLHACSEQLKTSTRRYAKRQLTWYRPFDWVNRVIPKDLTEHVFDYFQQI